MKLVIANKAYSSWSFRPWLLMKQFNIPFEEVFIALYQENTASEIAKYSGAGRVPILIDGDIHVWESLAIFEYLNEIKRIYPAEKAARAHCRAICNEMHAGFTDLRGRLQCNFRRSPKPRDYNEAVQANINRIIALWSEALEEFGGSYGFLYNQFSAADAMYAPVVSRFYAYNIAVPPHIKAYMSRMMALPAWNEWEAAAHKEKWIYDFYESDK